MPVIKSLQPHILQGASLNMAFFLHNPKAKQCITKSTGMPYDYLIVYP